MKLNKHKLIKVFSDERLLSSVVYAGLAVAVMYPLFGSGYILTLDISNMLGGPVRFQPYFYGLYGLNNRLPYYLTANLMNNIFHQWVTQKVFIFLALFLSGIGAHRLLVGKGRPARYFAGTLYVLNPFVYVRLMAGQLAVLLSYAFLPFAVYYFIRLLINKDYKSLLLTIGFTTLVAIFSVHFVVITAIVFMVLLIARIISQRHDKAYLKNLFAKILLLSGGLVLINSYWLLPALLGTSDSVSRIMAADAAIFSPRSQSGLPVMFDVASMHGFWRSGYTYVWDFFPFWVILFLFIIYLAIYGFTSKLLGKSQRWMVAGFGILGLTGIILATGKATAVTEPLFDFLWQHFFFFRGLRDSQKIVSILCLVYAFLGGLGVKELLNNFSRMDWAKARTKIMRIGQVLIIVIPVTVNVLYAWPIFGLSGQLRPVDYPKSWYEVNDYLNQDEDDFNVLFLPWHAWMDFSWLPNKDKSLANPAPHAFDKPIIKADNLEIGTVYSESSNPISNYIDFLLANRDDINNFGELLAPLNVKYIILVKEADYQALEFLYHQSDISVELEKQDIVLFKNEHPVSPVYGVDEVVYIEDLGDFLEHSKEHDVTEFVYLMGRGTLTGQASGNMKEIDIEETSPVRYRTGGTSSQYTVFTLPPDANNTGWKYDGQEPLQNLGFIPTFKSIPSGGVISYATFYRVYLPVYILSLIAFICFSVLFWFLRDKPEKQVI